MKNTLEISLLDQASITDEEVRHIINLKMQHWPYSFHSHKEWIGKNIKHDDLNLLLKTQGQLVGFLNLVKVNAHLNFQSYIDLLGVGNVCISKEFSGKGLGLLLMQVANYQIHASGNNGILLCSDKLVPFYLKAGWRKTQSEVLIGETKFDGNTMLLEGITPQLIVLNRNF